MSRLGENKGEIRDSGGANDTRSKVKTCWSVSRQVDLANALALAFGSLHHMLLEYMYPYIEREDQRLVSCLVFDRSSSPWRQNSQARRYWRHGRRVESENLKLQYRCNNSMDMQSLKVL